MASCVGRPPAGRSWSLPSSTVPSSPESNAGSHAIPRSSLRTSRFRWKKSRTHRPGHDRNDMEAVLMVEVIDTFTEAFPMTAARAIITADTLAWAEIAARTMTGYATSVIACDAEAGIERTLLPEETPDGRPGVSVLVFAFSR